MGAEIPWYVTWLAAVDHFLVDLRWKYATSLLLKIESYCAETGMSQRTFGRRVLGDAKLVKRLRRGRAVSGRKYGRVVAWIERHPPGRKALQQTGRAA